MVAELGLIDSLVGRSFECDYPPEVTQVESLVEPVIDQTLETHREIDQQINRAMEENGTIYRVDQRRLRSLNPDILITQDLCEVCAPSERELSQVIQTMNSPPEIVSMSPGSLSEIINNMRELADVTDTVDQFHRWNESVQEEFRRLKATREPGDTPGVVAVEWYDPLYVAGHWVPEQITLAGGHPLLSKPKQPSHVIEPEELLSADPDYLILMPCGMSANEALLGLDEFLSFQGFKQLSAVQNERVFTVDAGAYFARPGPRVVEGIQLLVHILRDEDSFTARFDDAYVNVYDSRELSESKNGL